MSTQVVITADRHASSYTYLNAEYRVGTNGELVVSRRDPDSVTGMGTKVVAIFAAGAWVRAFTEDEP